MKDKYIFKPAAGGGGFPPHQDMTFIYSRVCSDALNFGIAFDDADETNGSLEVAPGCVIVGCVFT
jgi:ectoine hydroxylase-related dioxygenase (phytanoyl-CoA dioxygenase family)